MTVTWKGNDPKRLIAKLEAFGKDAAKAAIEAVDETIEQGRRDVRDGIMNAPATNKNPGGGPRWETGAMFYGVDKSLTTDGKSKVTGKFGWLNPGSEAYDHASYQEPGTSTVTPMLALFAAHTLAANEIKRRLAEKGFKVR